MLRPPVLGRCLIEVKRDYLRVRNIVCSKRMSTSILVLALFGSLSLIYFGMSGYIPEIFCGVGFAMLGLTTPAILYLWCAADDRIMLRYLIKGTTHACQVLTGRARKRAGSRHLLPYDNPIPVVDDPINLSPVALEHGVETVKVATETDESQSDETTSESIPHAEVKTSNTWLAPDRTEASSLPLLGKARQGQSSPTESWTSKRMQRSFDGLKTPPIPDPILGPLEYKPVWKINLSDDIDPNPKQLMHVEKIPQIPGVASGPILNDPVWQTKDLSNKDMVSDSKIRVQQELPDQRLYSHVEKLQMPKVPQMISELTRLNHPDEKPGLHVLLGQETPVRGRISLVSQRLPSPKLLSSSTNELLKNRRTN